MTKMESLKLRAARALDVFQKQADDEQWEKLVEALEKEALAAYRIKTKDFERPAWMVGP